MFSSLFEVAKSSPFKTPFAGKVQCESSSSDKALVPSRNIQAAAATVPGDEVEFGSTHYFVLCGLGGILSCGKWFQFDRFVNF